jgi:hypothetical protein
MSLSSFLIFGRDECWNLVAGSLPFTRRIVLLEGLGLRIRKYTTIKSVSMPNTFAQIPRSRLRYSVVAVYVLLGSKVSFTCFAPLIQTHALFVFNIDRDNIRSVFIFITSF